MDMLKGAALIAAFIGFLTIFASGGRRVVAWYREHSRRSPYGISPSFLYSLSVRRFPRPWTVERIAGGFKVIDANGQSLAYVYGNADSHAAGIANALTLDEARRTASNIAKLPTLLGKVSED
jgi:hypothetical protein